MHYSRHLLALLSLGLAFTTQLAAAADCRAILDAGSSGTRLYMYEDVNGAWVEHEGPKVDPLADPLRGIRGKKWADIVPTGFAIASTLEQIKGDGPINAKGKPAWKGFDWSKACTLRSVSVYATAGMRLAEQEHPREAALAWDLVKGLIKNRVPADVQIQAKTLSGFEEGLFAWMSLNATGKGKDFGLIEMGGASSQVTFPCADCADAQTVKVGGAPVKMFSYSFLGLGGDEAVTTLNMQPVCAFGVGKTDPAWNQQRCADTIQLRGADGGIVDPYNYGPGGRGASKSMPAQMAQVPKWYATGAFSYMSDSDIDNCCVQGANSCFQPQTSCFRNVYFRKYIKELGVSGFEKSGSSWTLGAVVCDQTSCVADVAKRECRWMKDGCMVN